MTSPTFLCLRQRPVFLLILVLFVCSMLGDAPPANGYKGEQGSAAVQAETEGDESEALADLTVAEVQGAIIKTEGGILLDISRAFVFSIGGQRLDMASIKPGARIRASMTIRANSSAPFLAKFVQVRQEDEVVFVSELQAIDIENGFITVMNQRISIRESFLPGPGYKKLKVGRTITVIARVHGAELVATRISIDDRSAFTGAGIL